MKKEEFISLVKRTFDVYSKHEMDVYSGNATFYLMISTVPFLMMIIYIIKLFLSFLPIKKTNLHFKDII